MSFITDFLFGWFYDILYALQSSICSILDFIVLMFRRLIGIDTVTANGSSNDLLSYFLTSNGIRTAFFGILLVGVALLIVFTIIAILRSEAADGQHKKTKGQILVKSGQAAIIFLVIPFLVLAGITLSSVIMNAIDQSMTLAATGGLGQSTIGGQILVTSGTDAFIGWSGQRAQIEQQFINGTLDYNNLWTVKNYYHVPRINFFMGITSGLVILVMFVMAVIMFVQRIFDILLLYVVSPVSAATIPIDDGGRFRIWREMLIAKILGAFGIILSMNIFFLVIPQINNIRFFGNSFHNGLTGLLFTIGGAFSVTKANMVIAQLTGNNAGAQEAQQMLSNIHSGIRAGKMFGRGIAATGGRVIGGSDYIKNKKRGAGMAGGLASSFKSKRNQNEVSTDKTKPRSAMQKAGAATRLATMPLGMLKDLAQGGLITMGKNFIPRMRNAFTGTSLVSRADVKKKPPKPTAAKSDAKPNLSTSNGKAAEQTAQGRQDAPFDWATNPTQAVKDGRTKSKPTTAANKNTAVKNSVTQAAQSKQNSQPKQTNGATNSKSAGADINKIAQNALAKNTTKEVNKK